MKKYTKSEISSYLEEYRNGNESIRKFCTIKDISLSTFTSWLYPEKNKKKSENNKVKFCKIDIPKSVAKLDSKICIEYKGVKIHLENDVEICCLEKILKAVINT